MYFFSTLLITLTIIIVSSVNTYDISLFNVFIPNLFSIIFDVIHYSKNKLNGCLMQPLNTALIPSIREIKIEKSILVPSIILDLKYGLDDR